MPSLDLEVRTQLNLALAEAAANEALRIFSRTGDEIATGFGGRISRALGGFSTSAAQTELRALQSEYAKLEAAQKTASDLAIRRAGEVEVALRRKVGLQAGDTATAVESARAERALVDTRRAHEQALRRQETAIIATQAAHERLGDAAVLAGGKAETASRAFNILGVGAIAGTGIAMVETTKQAADFQQGLERLSAVTGDSAQNIKIVHDGILQMAGQVGYTAAELQDGMLLVEKAGYRGADGLKVLNVASQLASQEGADLKDTINGVTTSIHDFHIPVSQAADVTSKLNVAIGLSKVSAQDFGGALHNVEPIASGLGDNINDLYAALATLTQSGMGADQASQNLAHSFSSLAKPTQQMRDEMGALGLDSRDVAEHLGQRGIIGTANMLHDAVTKKLGPSGQVMLDTWYKSQQASDSASQMMAAMPPEVRAVADSIDNGTLSYAEFRKTRGGLAVEQANEINQWKAVEDKLSGFNTTLKSGQGDVQGEIQALATLVGGQDNLRTILQLTGENQQKANYTLQQLASTHADADGKTKGFAQSQDTYNAKMKDAKAAFESARIEVGEAFLPVMTQFLGVAKDVGGELAKHPGIVHGVVDAIGVLGGAWGTFKAINIAETILGPITRGLGVMAEEEGIAATAAGNLKTALSFGAVALPAVGAGLGVAAAVDNIPAIKQHFSGDHDPVSNWFHQHASWIPQPGYAGGGEMRAPGPKGRDSALFWGADGEHVWAAPEVEAAGGHAAMYAMRQAVLHRADGGAIGGADALYREARALNGGSYVWGSTDCSGAVSMLVDAAIGGSGRMSTATAASWLAARGFQPGMMPGALNVGWYNGGPGGGHMAATLPDGTHFESGGQHGGIMLGGSAAGAETSEFTNHMFLPMEGLYPDGPAGGAVGFGGGATGFGGMGGGGGGVPAGATAGVGPGGQSGYYTPNPQGVEKAQGRIADLDNQIHDLEERKSELKANASQSERDRLDHELEHAHRERDEAQGRLAEAQRGTFHAGGAGGRGGGGGSMLATPLPGNFGIGKGLPGMAEWLVDWIGDMAMAPWAASLGMGGSDGMGGDGGAPGGMPSISSGGYGGGMPSPGAMDVGAWMPSAGAGESVSTTGAGTPSPSGAPAAPSPAAATPHGPSTGWWGSGPWGSSPGGSTPPAPHDTADYKSWYANMPDSNTYWIGSPEPASGGGGQGPPKVSQKEIDEANTARFNRQPHDYNLPTPQFAPGGSSMQDMLNAAAQHGWSNKPIYGGLPGQPIFGDPIHRATGGPSGTDTVPAWLSPGEDVFSKDEVDAMGGISAVDQFRHALHRAGGGGILGVDDPVGETGAPAGMPITGTPAKPNAPTGAPPGIAQALGVPQQQDPNAPQGETVQSGTKSMPFNEGQSSPGLGISGGAGAQAAGMFPGGSLAFALAGRTIGYGGQAAAIGTEALMQTFLPDDSPLANFSNTVPGKILGAVAGARPAGKNMAGQQTPPQLTKDQVDAQTAKASGGRGESPLVGEMHNYGVNNGEDVASALSRQTYYSYNAGGPR